MQYTGARILIEALIEQGVDTIFGYPGGQVVNIYDELFKHSGRIRHILTSHEQHAAHAADGYARSTGKTGVCLATSGPGATNLVTGIATAYMDSVPMVAITGNVATGLLGKDSFQEVDIVGVTMPIVKHNWLVKDVRELAEVVREAFIVARYGRPGPVLIDIPKDVTVNTAEWPPQKVLDTGAKGTTAIAGGEAAAIAGAIAGEVLSERAARLAGRTRRRTFTDEDIEKAAVMLYEADRPMIYAGGGVAISGAFEELKALAELLQAPVAQSLMAIGSFPREHPLNMGMIGMHGTVASNKAVQKADLVITVGARFSDRVTSRADRFAKNAAILQFDIDPAEINKNIATLFHVTGDIKETLRLVLKKIPRVKPNLWGDDITKWKSRVPHAHHRKTALHPRFIIEETARELKKAFPRMEPLVVTDVGQHQMWAAQFYPFEQPRSFLTSGGLGTMGFGLGAAVGAAAGNPGRAVVLFTGDGSFRMNCAEMATLVNYSLPVLIVIFDNHVLGMVRQWQTLFFERRFSQTVLGGPPDFVKLAESYRLAAFRATDEASFSTALRNALVALKNGNSALIAAHIDQDEMVLPMVPGGKPLDEQILQ
ncbi:MAG: biosynthetic-type acetolactate synthase large subunit [Spirochaetaceae bacterium]|jgi:acetolactate synthase-1/2/3 large subunit|nr:biosynthetic-type acetolactate synthase large subunit [Spirochaetaceae bacterium]